MCRMMAVVGTRESGVEMARRFRSQAKSGRVLPMMTPGHADGWGIAYADVRGGLHYAGRSTRDATEDPSYDEAVARLAAAADRTVVLAHVRKLSKGKLVLEHTHPFLRGGLALAHNGTVHGLAPQGESDSVSLFSRLTMERAKGASVGDALARTVRDVDGAFTYTSLTMLVTDGRDVWGVRRIGNDPIACAPEQCAPDYYTLGVATLPDGSVLVSQEHELLGIDGWRALADGEMVHVAADGRATTTRVL